MTFSARRQTLQYGRSTSGDRSTFSLTPGTLFHLRPEEAFHPFGTKFGDIEREVQTSDGSRVPVLKGDQQLALPDLTMLLRGLSGAGAGNLVSTSSLSHDLDDMLECLVGADHTDFTGDTTAASPGSTNTVIMDAGAGGLAVVGAGALIQLETASAVYIARVVTDIVSDPTLTLDRISVNRYGVADTPNASSVVYAMRRYRLTPGVGDHPHWYLDVEDDANLRRIFRGCFGTAKLVAQRGGKLRLQISNHACMEFDDDEATASPSYSTPTRGSPIACVDAPLMIGDTLYQAYDYEIDLGLVVVEQAAQGGPSGNFGYFVADKKPMIRCKIYLGSDTTPTALTDSAFRTLQTGAAVSDMSIQFGNAVGQVCLVRASEARCLPSSEIIEDAGRRVASLTWEATGATPLDIYLG